MSTLTRNKLLCVLDQLREAHVHTTLRQDREGAVSINVVVPGERWEVDVLTDGSVELEVFRSDGTIFGESELHIESERQRTLENDRT